jgi:hypothetical protein
MRLTVFSLMPPNLLVQHPGHDRRADLSLSRGRGLHAVLELRRFRLVPQRLAGHVHTPLERAQELAVVDRLDEKIDGPPFMALTPASGAMKRWFDRSSGYGRTAEASPRRVVLACGRRERRDVS